MAFIEPMHRNKPNITYLITPPLSLQRLLISFALISLTEQLISLPHPRSHVL